jgi:hypothetical protein
VVEESRSALVALALCLAACDAAGAEVPPRDGDPVLFEAEVQPVLARSCAYLGCHGREGIPLTLYAVGYLRMIDPEGLIDPARPPLDERALSSAELEHNRLAIVARKDEHDPEGERFLRRLIAPEAGGVPHGDGTVVYASDDHADLDALRRFLETVDAPTYP